MRQCNAYYKASVYYEPSSFKFDFERPYHTIRLWGDPIDSINVAYSAVLFPRDQRSRWRESDFFWVWMSGLNEIYQRLTSFLARQRAYHTRTYLVIDRPSASNAHGAMNT